MKLPLKIETTLKWFTQIAPIVVEIKIVFSLKTTFIAAKAGKQNTQMHKTIAHEIYFFISMAFCCQ